MSGIGIAFGACNCSSPDCIVNGCAVLRRRIPMLPPLSIPAPFQACHGWQPIETAPKDGRVIMLASEFGAIGHGWWDDPAPEHACWITYQIGRFPNPMPPDFTHWMPLPAPPQPDT